VTAKLLDTVLSLTALMEEESDMLASPGLHPALGECSGAKVALVAALEAHLAMLDRAEPSWMEKLPPDGRQQMVAAIAALRDASVVNAEVLGRQLELSTEMIIAVAAEVQRLTGTNSATYGAQGALSQAVQATPISLNTRL